MVRVDAEFGRDGLEQLLFHFQHGLAGGEADAVGDAEDVGVDRHGRLAEGGVENHVGGLAPHAGQGFERGAVGGHLAAVLLDQHPAGGDEVLGLALVEADGLDVLGEPASPSA